MRITGKGQVTIPQDIRRRFGLLPQTEVEFLVKKGDVVLRRKAKAAARGRLLIRHISGRATVHMSTDEIMALTRES